MNIVEVITTINRMKEDGVIDDYAIGGAVGATFHLEPVSTLDVDIFVAFQHQAIISRHHLIAGWQQFSRLYIDEPS